MVRVTAILARVPVIKFRKGGIVGPTRTTTVGSCPAPAPGQSAPPTSQTQHMSTSCIPDIDLPLRYRRLPLSQEEIDKINGGGIV